MNIDNNKNINIITKFIFGPQPIFPIRNQKDEIILARKKEKLIRSQPIIRIAVE